MPWLVLDNLGIEPWQFFALLSIFFVGIPLAVGVGGYLLMSSLGRSRKLGFLLGTLWAAGIIAALAIEWLGEGVALILVVAAVVWICWQFRQRGRHPDE